MTTVTTASLSDALPTSVPKLEATRLNWAILLVHFRDAVDAKGFWGHFDGTTPVPSLSNPATSKETAAKSQWEKDEHSAKSLLTQKLPDSTLMKVHTKPTVQERWEAVVKEYTEKGAYVQTDMRAKFLASRCPEKGNVRDFLDQLRTKKEELVQVGVVISDSDYLSTIISSLPVSLSSFASAQLAAARMFAMTKTIKPDVLMSLLMEEAERQKAQQVRRAPKIGKNEDETPNEALGATTNSKPRKGKGQQNVSCWNCGRTGHYSNECKEPPKDEPPKESPETKTAAAVKLDCEDCEAWTVELIDDEMDWFESVIAKMDASSCIKDVVSVKIPIWDWFYEVTEDQDKSEGLCQDEAPIAHAVESEGEYQGDGNTCESSGWTPDLNIRTAETIARPLGNHKGGEDNSATKMPEIERDVYEEYSSVPRFEGEEENTNEKGLTHGPYPWHCCPQSFICYRNSEVFRTQTCF